MTIVSKEKLEAFKALEEQEVTFLKACGWTKGNNGWFHRELAALVPQTQEQAVMKAKRAIVKAQILRGMANV